MVAVVIAAVVLLPRSSEAAPVPIAVSLLTNTDTGCTIVPPATTATCGRSFSWTTPFNSDSTVYYSTTPPVWSLDTINSRVSSSNVAALASTSSGNAWGVGFGGKIIHRDSLTGDWSPQNSPTASTLYAVSAANDNTVWAVGKDATVLVTQNGGTIWSPSTISGASTLFDVKATSATTAWAVDANDVYEYVGGAWVRKLADATGQFTAVTSVDNLNVWAVGMNNTIRHTTEGNLNWDTGPQPTWQTKSPPATVPPSTVRFFSISTLDGETLWASGDSTPSYTGRLYRSADGGLSWQIVPEMSVYARIDHIQQTGTNTFWFLNGNQVGYFDYNNGTPLVTLHSRPANLFSAPPYSLALLNNYRALVGSEAQLVAQYAMPYTDPSFVSSWLNVSTASHSLSLGKTLLPNTTYYYAVESAGSGVTTGAFGGSFTTPTPDITPPVVTITQPSTATHYFNEAQVNHPASWDPTINVSDFGGNAYTYQIKGTATDNQSLNLSDQNVRPQPYKCTFSNGATGASLISGNVNAGGNMAGSLASGVFTWDWMISLIYAGEGDLNSSCTFSDVSNNITTTPAVHMVYDKTAPTIGSDDAVQYFWSETSIPNNPFTFGVTFADMMSPPNDAKIGSGIAKLQYQLNNDALPDNGVWKDVTVTDPAATSAAITLPALPVGDTDVEVRAIDRAGNISGNFGGPLTYTIPDNTPPTVSITPRPTFVNSCVTNFTVSGTAADMPPGVVKKVTVTLDVNPPVQAASSTAWATWSVNFPCAQLANGSHTVTAVSNDGTNDSLQDSVTFVMDRSIPVVTITPQGPVNTPTITLAGSATDGDQVVSVDVLPDPRTTIVTRQPAAVTAGPVAPWAIANLPMYPGDNTITVYARDRAGNEGLAVISIRYNVPTFTLSASPTAATAQAGVSATYIITATPVSNFTGQITFNAVGGPTSNGMSYSPATATIRTGDPFVTTTLTITTTTTDISSTAYPTTISATTTTPNTLPALSIKVFTTVIVAADYTPSVSPSSRTVVEGLSALYTISISGTLTYNVPPSSLRFSIGTLPTGVTATFGTVSGDARAKGVATQTLTLATTVKAPNTSIPIYINDGVLPEHVITIGLTVTAQPNYTISAPPPPSGTVTAGPTTSAASIASYNVNFTAVDGFNGPVTVSLADSGDPNITATISPNTFTPATTGTIVTINVHAGSPTVTPHGSQNTPDYTILFTATTTVTGIPDKQFTVLLTVNPDITAPFIPETITAAPDYQSATISWTTDEPANSKVEIFEDAELLIKIGSFSTSDFCTSTCHRLSYSPLDSEHTYYYAITSVDSAYKPVNPQGNLTRVTRQKGNPLSFRTTVAPDLTKPTIELLSPADGVTVVGTVGVSMRATDNNPLARITMTIAPVGNPSDPHAIDMSFPCSTTDCTPVIYQWNTMQALDFPNGDYLISVESFSTSGDSVYNHSGVVSVIVTVDNDRHPPQILCLENQINCGPKAENLQCDDLTKLCTIEIHWKTSSRSTSEVAYGTEVDCTNNEVRTLADNSQVTMDCVYPLNQKYDNGTLAAPTNPDNANPDYIDHRVRLRNLQQGLLFHYRVTSCNISYLCTN